LRLTGQSSADAGEGAGHGWPLTPGAGTPGGGGLRRANKPFTLAPAISARSVRERDRSMSSVRNWPAGSAIAALILLSPALAFLMVIAAELVIDFAMEVGAAAVWPVAAGAVGWVLLRKYGWLPRISQLRAGGA
jgi:hypothetical protein